MRRLIIIGAMMLLAASGCSSDTVSVASPVRGLTPGRMEVAINGRSAVDQRDLACMQIGSETMATTGAGNSMVRAVVNGGHNLRTVSVQFTNFAGFTGSYWADLQGEAQAELIGSSTFVISGKADGFFIDHPVDNTSSDFTVKFAC